METQGQGSRTEARRVAVAQLPVVTSEPGELKTFVVTLDTPGGVGELEVPTTLGPDAAGRRAWAMGLAMGWGDVHEITVTSVVDLKVVEALSE